MDMGPELFAWYRGRERAYPWRGDRPDPYGVLVSEAMLQQTQAARVAPAYRRFMRRFPTLGALAAAPRREVVAAWNGLGYNRRAVALSEAARTVIARHDGRIPSDPGILATLPGVGPYTAAAVASLAYGATVPAVDTNVRRVVARFVLGAEPGEVAAGPARLAAKAVLDRGDPGRWNQAVMDLGREVCRPAPRCDECPLANRCRFRRSGREAGRADRAEWAGRAGRDGKRGQPPFQGSFRQLRGSVVRTLAARGAATLGSLASQSDEPLERVARAVHALAAEGLVRAGPQALGGNPRGLVRLA
jgi:A/G-specific adenine glycosylase